MALSMEEQRILAEIERQLGEDDPSLAAGLATFRRPGLTARFRTPRGRMLVSVFVVAAVALLSLMVYSLMPLRVVPDRAVHQPGQASATAQARSKAPAGATTGKPGAAGRQAPSPKAGKPAG